MLSLTTKSNKTINQIIKRLSHIIEWCIKEYSLSLQNPAKAIKKLKIDNARERFLAKDEVERLLELANKKLVKTKTPNGYSTYRWEKIRERNEGLDLFVLCLAGAKIMKLDSLDFVKSSQ